MKRLSLFFVVFLTFCFCANVLMADEVTVGAGDQLATLPIDFHYRNTLYETIYLSSELNIGGQISGLRFYNNFYESISNVNINIWLGETLSADLTGGWITPAQLTQVYSGSISFPSGINNINITFPIPYFYSGNNLVMLVEYPWQDDYYMTSNNFYAQTVGTSRSRLTYNSNYPIDPNSPPQTGLSGQFPKTTFIYTVSGMGSLSGSVSSGGAPLENALVTVANSVLTATTAADGSYSFPYLAAGTHAVSASKLGYGEVSHTVNITENQNTAQNFILSQLPLISVSGMVTGSDEPLAGLAGATVTLSGYAFFETATDAGGLFTLPNVYGSQAYTLTVSADGYQDYVANLLLGTVNHDTGTITLSEFALPPLNPSAVESADQSYVTIDWEAPVTAEEGWLHYDSGDNFTGFGTQGNSFTVAVRFPASALADYAGTSLFAMKVWPNTGAGWNLRVWTGGNASDPGTIVVDQPFVPVLNSYNTILLDNPVPITGSEELWFGYHINGENMSHAHAGVDAGPAVHGFGNMIQWQGNWTTLLAVNSYCDFNWNIQGYAGFGPPDGLSPLLPVFLPEKAMFLSNSSSSKSGRPLTGYQVWRLQQGQENNPDAWTGLTPSPITETTLQDDDWDNLPSGTYVWAIRSVYTGGISESVFTNALEKIIPTGILTGTVRTILNLPVSGATIAAGDSTALTGPTGAYSLTLPAGTYDVTASHPNYLPGTVPGVEIVAGETTVQDFNLTLVGNEDELNPVSVTALLGNYPNPFQAGTRIIYSLKEAAPVTVSIYNLKGELVRCLSSEIKEAGDHTLEWDGKDLKDRRVPNGIYFCRLESGKNSFTRKLLKLK